MGVERSDTIHNFAACNHVRCSGEVALVDIDLLQKMDIHFVAVNRAGACRGIRYEFDPATDKSAVGVIEQGTDTRSQPSGMGDAVNIGER